MRPVAIVPAGGLALQPAPLAEGGEGLLPGLRKTAVAALLQSTSLPFIVAATAIGIDLGAIEPGTAAAFIAAGLLSVVIFPATALALLGKRSSG